MTAVFKTQQNALNIVWPLWCFDVLLDAKKATQTANKTDNALLNKPEGLLTDAPTCSP
jgi:regulatory protein YycI of two-component signal transduction system YycFG